MEFKESSSFDGCEIGAELHIRNRPDIKSASFQGTSDSGKTVRVKVHSGYVHSYIAYFNPQNVALKEG